MLIAVLTAVAVFCVSAFAAGANVSGYERLKAAGFNFVEQINKKDGFYSNGSYWINTALYLDGAEMFRAEQAILKDGARTFMQETEYYAQDALFPFGRSMNFVDGIYGKNTLTYNDDEVFYRWSDDGSFTSGQNRWGGFRGYYGGESEYDGAIPPAQKRFIEALTDALVGETRNYFVTDGNMISISLSGNQIPELAQFAIAAIAERAGGDLKTISNMSIGEDARFTKGMLEVELNDEGFGVNAKMFVEIESTVDGKQQTYRFETEAISRNIGSTELQRPDGNENGRPSLPSPDGGSTGVTYAQAAASI